MAKIKSIIDISGSVSGLTFYTVEGKRYVKNKSSLNREKVMKDPAFARSREQMSEFGGAAALGKALRTIWAPFKKRAADSRIAGRLNARLLQCLRSAPGIRGQRSFILRDHAAQLVGFSLRKDVWLSAYLDAPRFEPSPDRRQMEISFHAGTKAKAVKGATHFRILAAFGMVSDFAYDSAEKRYLPLDPQQHGLSATSQSPEWDITAGNIPVLNLQLPPAAQPGPQHSVLLVCGLEYLQYVNGSYETLQEHSMMHIAWVG